MWEPEEAFLFGGGAARVWGRFEMKKGPSRKLLPRIFSSLGPSLVLWKWFRALLCHQRREGGFDAGWDRRRPRGVAPQDRMIALPLPLPLLLTRRGKRGTDP